MFRPALPGLFGDGPGACITWAIHGPIEGFHSLYDSIGNVVYGTLDILGKYLSLYLSPPPPPPPPLPPRRSFVSCCAARFPGALCDGKHLVRAMCLSPVIGC